MVNLTENTLPTDKISEKELREIAGLCAHCGRSRREWTDKLCEDCHERHATPYYRAAAEPLYIREQRARCA